MSAPPFVCVHCSRTIPARRGHNVTDTGHVLCGRCIFDRRLHDQLFPDCPDRWHDMFDHLRFVAGTRAGTAAVLTTERPTP